MDRHETQTEMSPTRDQWLTLHQAFRGYCEARPWERLANEDVLAVNDPLGRSRGTAWPWAMAESCTAWEFTWVTGASSII